MTLISPKYKDTGNLPANSVNDTEIDFGTGTNQVSLSDIPTNYVDGSILFIDSNNITEDNSNFFYDNTNNRLKANKARFGGATNYSDFEADGTIEFNGNATVWKDINLGSAMLSKPSSSQPDTDEFKDEAGSDTGIETYAFAPGEKVSGTFEIQHDYKTGSDITFHVHWQGIAAPTGTDKVKWQLIYTFSRDGETLDATTTITGESDIDTQYDSIRTDLTTITGSTAVNGGNLEIGDQMLFQLSRIAASADEYGGDALLETAGIHYEVDTIGSRQIITK
jgi:hypothetical protein